VKWWRLHKAGTRDAAELLAAAEREAELSRQRLRDAHEQVIEPLRGYAERNNFAALIRDSLVQGHRKGAPE
jgi:hypothetical protein